MARRRPLPKVLRFLGQVFTVEVVAHLVHQNDDPESHDHEHKAYGVYTPQVNTIWLDNENGRNRMQVTFMHEALHAMLDAAHCEIAEEEDTVGALAPLLVDFMRGNRAAVAYIQDAQ